MFSIATVASSTRMPTASARPPSVMMLIVSPSALSTMIERQDRQRNRDRDDHRAAPAAEEDQDHQRGQARGDHRLAQHARDRRRCTNTDWSASGLISSSGGRPAAIRGSAALIAMMMSSVEALPIFWIVSSARALAVDADDVGLRRVAVADVGDVADVDRCAADRLDRQVVELLDVVGLAFSRRRIRSSPIFERAARQDQVLHADRVDDVGRRQALGLQRLRDRGRPGSAAACRRTGYGIDAPCTRRELRAEEVHAEVEQLLLGQALAREAELQDRHASTRCR